MAHTKRKRRSKHRGHAAGTIEARGRPGRKPTAGERSKGESRSPREERRFQKPTLASAAVRAGLASVMLFVLFQVGLAGEQQSVVSSLMLALLAFLIYVPLGYKVDNMIWKRRMRKAGREIPPPAKR